MSNLVDQSGTLPLRAPLGERENSLTGRASLLQLPFKTRCLYSNGRSGIGERCAVTVDLAVAAELGI